MGTFSFSTQSSYPGLFISSFSSSTAKGAIHICCLQLGRTCGFLGFVCDFYEMVKYPARKVIRNSWNLASTLKMTDSVIFCTSGIYKNLQFPR